MIHPFVLGIAALATLVPAAVLPLRASASTAGGRDAAFWILTAVATAGPLGLELALSQQAWHTGFSASLWTIVAATMLVFLVASAVTRNAWRLSGLLLPYLVVLAILALAWMSAPGGQISNAAISLWIEVHIVISLLTYGLLTLAAMAAMAVWLKERALRAHQVATGWLDALPSVADAERLQVGLLILAEIVLGLGVATGMASQYGETGTLFRFDHKTVLSLATFVVVGALLLFHAVSGLRGRRAARVVLLAYLLITLAFPGVKFVTDVMLG